MEEQRSPFAVFDAVLADLEATKHLAPESFDSSADKIRSFARYCQTGLHLESVAQITPDVAEAFIYAPKRLGGQPSLATMHGRRSAVRLLYARGRTMGLLEWDPTVDIELPIRQAVGVRPLDDDEITLGREWALDQRERGFRAPVWALAEAGAHQGEIAEVQIEDLDLECGTVHFRGGRRAIPRTVPLTGWGTDQIARYLRRMGDPARGRLLPLPHPKHKGRASLVGMTLGGILKDARLIAPDVTARSIVAWTGTKAFCEEERIQDVARRLGMRSLDAAASLIGWDWRAESR